MADDAEGSEANEEAYEVEAIVGDRKRGGVQEFLVKWRGFRWNKNTWEALADLEGAQDLVDAYVAEKFSRKDAAIRRKPVVRSDSDPDLIPLKKAKAKPPRGKADELEAVIGVRKKGKKLLFQVERSDGEEVTLSRSELRKKNPLALLEFFQSVFTT
jgi:chromobox protein 1